MWKNSVRGSLWWKEAKVKEGMAIPPKLYYGGKREYDTYKKCNYNRVQFFFPNEDFFLVIRLFSLLNNT